MQILTGDFNAEPQEEAVIYLQRADSYGSQWSCNDDFFQPERDSQANNDSNDKKKNNDHNNNIGESRATRATSAFVDTWKDVRVKALRLQSEQQAASLRFADVSRDKETEEQRILEEAERDGLTFPACNPVKRIDFIFARNHSSSSDSTSREWFVSISDSRVIGQKPTADTEHLVGSREGLGMLDEDSPVWASDHYGLVSDFLIDSKT